MIDVAAAAFETSTDAVVPAIVPVFVMGWLS